ncbi:ferritin-like domain-containing protein [Chromohalobacter canadensis]|uniref:ferritin-like domain-containing protein n=1 Tax=Chromohalobacter canadensis TaxID=141389 RepID=UPI00240EEE67|nr:ferritin-like domain-containing protein [Chromohalobacter canadensis]
MSTSSVSQLHVWLKDAHAMEEQAEQMLTAQAKRLEHYPKLKERINQHIEETKSQADRLEGCLKSMDESPSTMKDVSGKFAAIGQAIGGSMASDEVVKGGIASYAFEHFEIANYRALIAAADELGENQIREVCKGILEEEVNMAKWLEDNLDDITKAFLSRAESEALEGKR